MARRSFERHGNLAQTCNRTSGSAGRNARSHLRNVAARTHGVRAAGPSLDEVKKGGAKASLLFRPRTPSARPRPCHRHKRSSSNMVEIFGCTTRAYFEGKRKVTTAPPILILYSLFFILITTMYEVSNRLLAPFRGPSHHAVLCVCD